ARRMMVHACCCELGLPGERSRMLGGRGRFREERVAAPAEPRLTLPREWREMLSFYRLQDGVREWLDAALPKDRDRKTQLFVTGERDAPLVDVERMISKLGARQVREDGVMVVQPGAQPALREPLQIDVFRSAWLENP